MAKKNHVSEGPFLISWGPDATVFWGVAGCGGVLVLLAYILMVHLKTSRTVVRRFECNQPISESGWISEWLFSQCVLLL